MYKFLELTLSQSQVSKNLRFKKKNQWILNIKKKKNYVYNNRIVKDLRLYLV